MSHNTFALRWWKQVVTAPHPHVVWPPEVTYEEQEEYRFVRSSGAWKEYFTTTRNQLKEWVQQLLGDWSEYCTILPSVSELFSTITTILDIWAQDRVICSALWAQQTFEVLEQCESDVVLYYPSLETWVCSEELLCSLISHDTRLVVISHHRWWQQSLQKVYDHCANIWAIIVEDCSEVVWVYSPAPQQHDHSVQFVSLWSTWLLFSWIGVACCTNNTLFHECIQQYFKPDRTKELEYLWPYRPHWMWHSLNPIHAKYSLKNSDKIMQWSRECFEYLKKRLGWVGYMSFLQDWTNTLSWYRFVLQYDSSKLQSVSVHTLMRLLRSEWVQCMQWTELYERNITSVYWFDASFKNSLQTLLFLPPFYDLDQHKDTINQYVAAFIKIQRNLFGE